MVRCDLCGEYCGDKGMLVKLPLGTRLIICDACYDGFKLYTLIRGVEVEFKWGFEDEEEAVDEKEWAPGRR